jgi:hypothetical protein
MGTETRTFRTPCIGRFRGSIRRHPAYAGRDGFSLDPNRTETNHARSVTPHLARPSSPCSPAGVRSGLRSRRGGDERDIVGVLSNRFKLPKPTIQRVILAEAITHERTAATLRNGIMNTLTLAKDIDAAIEHEILAPAS